MADTASLGTVILDVEADAKEARAEMAAYEKSSLASAKRIEKGVKDSIEKAYKGAQGSITQTALKVQAGAKLTESALIGPRTKFLEWKQAIEKVRGSWDQATAEEIADAERLEAAMKKVKAAIDAANKKPPEMSPSDPNMYAAPIGPGTGAAFGELEKISVKVRTAIADVNAEIAEGKYSEGQIKRLATLQTLYKQTIDDTHGSMDKATPGIVEDYKQIEKEIARTTAKVAELKNNWEDQKGVLSQAGAQWNGLGDAIGKVLGKQGAMIAKAGLVKAAVTEGLSIGVGIGKAIGVQYEAWEHFQKDVAKTSRPLVNRLGDVQNVITGISLSLITLNKEYARNALVGALISGKSLFGPMVDPRTGRPLQSQAYRIQLERYESFYNTNLPQLPRVRHQQDLLIPQINAAHLRRDAHAVRELTEQLNELNRTEETIITTVRQRIAQMELEYAQTTGNKKAVADLDATFDALLKSEMKIAGYDMASQEVKDILHWTEVNRELARTIANINERMEDLGMLREVASGNFNFAEQKQIARLYTEQALRLAELTGRSKQHIQALRDQLAIQLRQIEIERIGREEQDPLDLRRQIADAEERFSVQRDLASAYLETELAVAGLEKRDEAYLKLLTRLNEIERARINQAEIGSRINIAQAQSDLAIIQQQLSATGAYGQTIDDLRREIGELTAKQLDASPSWIDRTILAPLLRSKNAAEDLLIKATRLREFQSMLASMARDESRITMPYELMTRDDVRQAHRDRVQGFEEMVRQNTLSFERSRALILQSEQLTTAQLRQIDADYGKDWGALIERMVLKYEDEFKKIGATTERFVDMTHGLFSDVLFTGITEGLHELDDLFKSFAKSVLRELSNILASKAIASLLSLVPSLTGRWGSAATTANAPTGIPLPGGGAAVFSAPSGSGAVSFGLPPTSSANAISNRFSGVGLSSQSATSPNYAATTAQSAAGVEPRWANPQPMTIEVVWTAELIRGIVAAGAAQGAQMARRQVVPVLMNELNSNGPLRQTIRAV